MKTLKISALALAVLAVFGFVLNTQAQTNSEVSITIEAGTNACTLDAYSFSNTGVSATDVDLGTLTNELACTLYKSTANTLTIEQNDLAGLTAGNGITKDNVTVSSTIFTNVGSLTYTTAFGPESTWASALNLYEILADEVGTTSADVTVGLIVPGGTAADSYAGNLVITVPNT